VREAAAERVIVFETVEVFEALVLPVIVGLIAPDRLLTDEFDAFALAEFVVDTVFVFV
jgi:hypothetical protein